MVRRSLSILIVCLVLFSISGYATEKPSILSLSQSHIKVLAFTTNFYPLKNSHLANQVYLLNAVEQLEETMSQHFSTNSNQAEQQAKQLMASPQWKIVEQQLAQAYEGVDEGWKKGIIKVTAIIFIENENSDAAKVIYGETDVASAIQRYLSYRQNLNKE